MFQMGPDKAPGLDGLNLGFFQRFWTVLEAPVMEFVQDTFRMGKLPKGMNETLICLIRKVVSPKDLSQL